jgi:hypothetical protein
MLNIPNQPSVGVGGGGKTADRVQGRTTYLPFLQHRPKMYNDIMYRKSFKDNLIDQWSFFIKKNKKSYEATK